MNIINNIINLSEKTIFQQYPDVVNIKQLQEMLHIGKNLAYKLINTGKIESIRLGSVHRIPKSNIIDFLLKENNGKQMTA